MKKLIFFALFIFACSQLHAAWSTTPSATASLGGTVSAAVSANANAGNPLTYLVIWLKNPSGTWSSVQVATGANGAPLNASKSMVLNTGGTWTWEATLSTSSPGSSPAGTVVGPVTNTVVAIPTTFTFSNLSYTYDGATHTATATPNPAGATYSASLTGGPGVGSYGVSATANGSYTGSGSATLTISAAPTSFSLNSTSFTYTGAAQGPSVVPNPAGATYSTGGTLSATIPGSYTATATANGNYTGSNGSLTWTINKASQSISFSNPGTQTYGIPLTLSATASSGLAVSYAITSGPATLSGNTVTFTGSGSVTITASQAGNSNFNAAANVPVTFSVGLASQTITFAQPGTQTYGTPLTLNATASSGLAVSYAVTSGPATVSGSVVTFTGGGSVTVTASQAGNANYAAAANVARTFSVSTASQTITFANPGAQNQATPLTLTATASSGLPVTYTVTSGPATVSGNVVTFTGAGSVTITASQAGNANYSAAANVAQTFTVNPSVPVVSSPLTATGQVGVAFTYQITASGSPTGFAATGLPAGLSVNTSTGAITGTPTAAATTNVAISATNVSGTGSATLSLAVNPPGPVITSPTSATASVGGAFSYQITATNSPTAFNASGLPAGLSVNTTTGAITGTPTTAGTSTVTVSASNAGGTGTASVSLVVSSGMVINSPNTASGGVGTAFSYQITATNNPTSFSATGLPAGLTLNTTTGAITGTPTTIGSTVVTITATNAGGSVSIQLTLTILPTLPYTTDFESSQGYSVASLNSQLGWTVSQGAAAVATDDHALGAQSAKLAAGATAAILQQAFASSAGQTIEFFDFFAKPVAETNLASATTFTVEGAKFALMLSGTQGVINVFTGNGTGGGTWTATATSIALGAGNQAQAWTRFTVRLDFTHHTWDLYVGGQMITADIPFINNTSTYLSVFQVQGDLSTSSYIDDIYAGATNPLFADTNNNGIDDAWETAHGLSLSSYNRNLSPSGNGVTVIQAYVGNTNPNDFYNGSVPSLVIVGGNNQVAAPGQFNAQTFDVGVWNHAATAPLVGAPVTFSVQTGGGQLALTNTGSPTLSGTLTLNTDSIGTAQVYYQQPNSPSVQSTITLTAGTAQLTFTTATNAGAATDTDGDGIPDAWEIANGLDPNNPADAATIAPNSGGMTYLQVYKAGVYLLGLQQSGAPIPTGYQLVLVAPGNRLYAVNTSNWQISQIPTPP